MGLSWKICAFWGLGHEHEGSSAEATEPQGVAQVIQGLWVSAGKGLGDEFRLQGNHRPQPAKEQARPG